MADSVIVKMTHPKGAVVRVREEKVAQLKAMGFKKSAASSASPTASSPAAPPAAADAGEK